jgi:group II intron reverse transcriptase/maturase
MMRKDNPQLPNTELCEKLLSNENLKAAFIKVKKNGGAAGIDKMNVCELDTYLDSNIKDIKSKIISRKYKFSAVKRVEIPKDNGKTRMLGIPTVVDRFVQQLVVQVITPLFESTFSDFSYGYRPNRSAEDAVRQAQIYIAEGYKYVVDMDLSKFFDTVNHDKLMGLIDETLEDKDIRRLIFSSLKSGVMENGFKVETNVGTPQGGVISPILSNIYLTPFDKEMEKRGVKFIRYADDIQLFAKSKMASLRIRDNAIKFLEKKLQLTVNKEKTKAGRANGSKILGFVFQTRGKKRDDGVLKLGRCVPREKSLDKLKARVREITKRNRGVSLERVITELNSLLRGWINYYARSSIKMKLRDIMEWTRRRVRQYAYKIWKTSKNRKHQLRLLGTEEWKLKKSFLSSNSYWKMSQAIRRIFTNAMLHERLKLIDGLRLYVEKHEEAKEKDKDIIYFDFLAKRMADEEEGLELLKEDWIYFNIVRYV